MQYKDLIYKNGNDDIYLYTDNDLYCLSAYIKGIHTHYESVSFVLAKIKFKELVKSALDS